MIRVNGFLGDSPKLQFEGNGGLISSNGEKLFLLYHQGGLQINEYFPSLMLSVDLLSGEYQSSFLDAEIGFPKSYAVPIDKSHFVLVDHDKENENTKLPDGNWRGGYIFKVSLGGTVEALSYELNSAIGAVPDRLFWHDIKPLSDGFIALGFSGWGNSTLISFDSNFKPIKSLVIERSAGALEVVGNEVVLAPYGSKSDEVLFLDSQLNINNRVSLPKGDYKFHEIHLVDSIDGKERLLGFQEESISVNFISVDRDFDVIGNFPEQIRTTFQSEINGDNIKDLIVNTNSGSHFFLNNGQGGFVEIYAPTLEKQFNIMPVSQYMTSMSWPTASPELQISETSKINFLVDLEKSVEIEDISFVNGAIVYKGDLSWEFYRIEPNTILRKQDYIPVMKAPKKFTPSVDLDSLSTTTNTQVSVFSYIADVKSITLSDSISRLKCIDGSIALDIEGANSAGGIYRTYKAAFNRTPEKTGFGYWIDRADNGASAVQMAEEFVWSAEFQTLYGVTTSDNYLVGNDIEAVVDLFYRNVLGRAPDQGGLTYYTSTIEDQNKTGGQVLAEIADSAENRANLLPTIENGMSYDLWLG